METADNVTFSDVNSDCDSAYIDPQVYLFQKRTDGSLSFVASNDDAGDDNSVYFSRGRTDGSVTAEDSYLIRQLSQGTYVLAVGRYPLSQAAAAAGRSTDSVNAFSPYFCMARNASYGNYKMTVRVQSSSTQSVITKKANSYVGNSCSVPSSVTAECVYALPQTSAKQLVREGHNIVADMRAVLLHRDYVAIRERQNADRCGMRWRLRLALHAAGLTAIRLAAGPHGCLVIVKNYTGDRLNFGLAVEQAKAEGLKCDMVVVGEDVAVVNANAGRRGLSGTVFVHKLAGAAAKMGKDLATLVKMVNGLITESKLGTMGVAIKPCTLPGKEDTSREWGDNEMEVGLGIHDKISDQTSVGLGLKQGSKAVLMVNNLGSTTNMELYVVAKYAVEALQAKGIEPERFSLSLWNSNGDAEMLALFDAPTSAPAWTYSPFDLSQSTLSGSFIKAEAPAQTQKTFQRPAELSNKDFCSRSTFIKNEPQLTNWDTKVGDGDCGTTFKNAAEAILVDLKAHYPLNDASQTLRALADSVGRSAGGTSGVLYVIFLTAGSLHLESCKEADTTAWVGAFRAGISAIQKYGGATEGSRTMVDALVPSLRALDNQASKTGAELATAAAKAAQEGADATAHMSTKQAFGRAGYVGEDLVLAAAFWIQAIADTLNSS
ncbi:DhaL domain [Phytophthora cactorum]|nr:DhaL domain [Phytophthora cactorum]